MEKQILENALVTLIEKVTSGVDFLVSEIPDVVHQLLMWNMVESLIWFIGMWLGFVIIAVSASMNAKRIYLKWSGIKKENGDNSAWCDEPGDFFGTVIPYVCLFVWFLSCVRLCNFTWLKIWLAPKVWLIEYAAELVK